MSREVFASKIVVMTSLPAVVLGAALLTAGPAIASPALNGSAADDVRAGASFSAISPSPSTGSPEPPHYPHWNDQGDGGWLDQKRWNSGSDRKDGNWWEDQQDEKRGLKDSVNKLNNR